MRREARAAAAITDKRFSELRSAAQRLAADIVNRALVSTEGASPNQAATPRARIQDMLPRALQDYGLDFAIVADAQGRVIARHNNDPAPTESLIAGDDRNAVAERALSSGQPIAAAAVERGARLQALGLDLRAQVKLINGATFDEALMIEAASPIQSGGRMVGVILIGQMLNNEWKRRAGEAPPQTPLVYEVHQTLYGGEQADGVAAIAFQNVVITSKVTGAGGGPESTLTGVPCDASRPEEVLEQSGERYAIAWQPIKAAGGEDAGHIGVAHSMRALAGPTAARTTLLLIAALAALAAGAGGFFYGRAMGLRLDNLNEAVTRWSVGELSAPARDDEPMMPRMAGFAARDEIGRLAASLEQMRESFRQAIDRIRRR